MLSSILPVSLLNLAPLRYANCFQSEGGPLSALEESTLEIGGKRLAVANATLSETCRPASRHHQVFGNADGTGVHPNPVTARHIAISEAVERWAHTALWHSPEGKKYGFDHDPSSNGMSAFPGLIRAHARQFAYEEAIERFSLISWWEGLTGIEVLPKSTKGERLYRIIQPFSSHEVVISRRTTFEGFIAYGYGCGRTTKSAAEKALLERERASMVLARFWNRNPGFEIGDLSTIPNFMERRVVYFALPEGTAAFDARANQPPPVRPLAKPDVLFDGEIDGPWARFATVWRVAFRMPTLRFLDPNCTFFFW